MGSVEDFQVRVRTVRTAPGVRSQLFVRAIIVLVIFRVVWLHVLIAFEWSECRCSMAPTTTVTVRVRVRVMCGGCP